MTTRSRTMATIGREIDAADVAAMPEQETPGAMPPAGVPAQVETRIRYEARVDPDKETGRYSQDLRDLAAAEDRPDLPVDPLAEWLETWAQFTGYNCWVIRMPDPSTRRPPGIPYTRSNFGPPEQLGAVTFDPNPINFVAMLQMINGNSGGVFQIWLIDPANRQIPDSVLYNVAIADPPRTQQAQATPAPQQPRERQETEEEREVKEFRRELMRASMQRLLNPPPAPPPPPGSNLSQEDQAKLYLLNQGAGNLFPSMFTQMMEMQKSMMEVANATGKEPTWKDRAIDAAIGLAEHNPAIVERLSGVAERVVTNVTRMFMPPEPQPTPAPAPYYQQAPQYLPPQPPPPQTYAPPPTPAPAGEDLTTDEDDIEMDILDEFITLLNSDKVLSKDDPVFIALSRKYPEQFRQAVRMIAAAPTSGVIMWASSKGKLYQSMLNGPGGAYLRGRIGELQTVFKNALSDAEKQKQQPATEPAPQPEPIAPEAQAAIIDSAADEEGSSQGL